MVSSKPSVYLFIGDNDYLKEKAISDLKSSILKGSSGGDLDYKIFHGGEVNFREVLDSVTTIPLLSVKRLVVIKNIEELNEEDLGRLIAYMREPLKSTCLVLDATSDSVINEHEELARFANINRFDDLTDAEFQGWVKSFVESKTGLKKKIEDDAAKELKELHKEILRMGVLVQEAIFKSIEALKNRDKAQAKEVIDRIWPKLRPASEKRVCRTFGAAHS